MDIVPLLNSDDNTGVKILFFSSNTSNPGKSSVMLKGLSWNENSLYSYDS